MVTRIPFFVSCSVMLLIGIATPTTGQIIVGANVQVSRARASAMHNEVLIAADPSDARRLIGCSMIGPSPAGKWITGAYASFDGGVTWVPVMADDQDFNSADPACVYGIGGTALFASLGSGKDRKTRLKAYHSEDGGKTWTGSKIPDASSDMLDREYIAVDNTRGNYHGRIYIYGQRRGYGLDDRLPDGITLFRSLDGGKTYERPIQRLAPDRTTVVHPGNAIVLSDGTFVAVFAQLIIDKRNDGYPDGQSVPASRPSGFIKVMTSSDGGDTLNPATQVSDMYADWRQQAKSTIPRVDADVFTSVFRDRIYAVWADGRFGGRTQIVLSYSTDKGNTWSKPRLVNDDRLPARGALERSAAMPAVAVNKDGIIGVTWYDRRDSPNDVDYYVRFAASLDGGETFTSSVRVSERPRVFDQNEQWPIKGLAIAEKTGPVRLVIIRDEWLSSGDTAGLAADASGIFHPLWIDDRTGVRQVWTASVSVKGSGMKHGDAALSRLDDITSKVEIEVMDSSYDRLKNEGTVSIRLKNTSKDTIVAPIKLRALSLTSELGVVHVVNAENRETGDGAFWDFTALLENGSLTPGAVTGVKSLSFRLSDFGSFRQPNGQYKWIFVDVDAIVLGSVRAAKTTAQP